MIVSKSVDWYGYTVKTCVIQRKCIGMTENYYNKKSILLIPFDNTTELYRIHV